MRDGYGLELLRFGAAQSEMNTLLRRGLTSRMDQGRESEGGESTGMNQGN